MLEIGKTYYFVVHAYHHFVATLTAIHGVRRVAVRNVVKVHSCQRSWTDFFAQGFENDTKYDHLTDSPDFPYLLVFDWPHAVPEAK